jgi:hypothetical protein
MWYRYTVGNLEFAQIVAAQWVRRSLLNACVGLASRDKYAAELQEIAVLQSERLAAILSVIETRESALPTDSVAV